MMFVENIYVSVAYNANCFTMTEEKTGAKVKMVRQHHGLYKNDSSFTFEEGVNLTFYVDFTISNRYAFCILYEDDINYKHVTERYDITVDPNCTTFSGNTTLSVYRQYDTHAAIELHCYPVVDDI
jgi:hypothetical protein